MNQPARDGLIVVEKCTEKPSGKAIRLTEVGLALQASCPRLLAEVEPPWEERCVDVRKPRWRWVLVVAAIVALGAIWLLGPKYAQLQLATDAEAFRRIVGEDPGRYLSAGAADLAFAPSYGLLALAIARTPPASRTGAWLVFVGAVFDEAENALLMANVSAGVTVSDGRVELMRTAGVAKYVALGAGVLLYLGSWAIERLGRR